MGHSTVCEKIFYFVAQIKAFPNTNRLLNSLAYGDELRGNPPANNVNVMPSWQIKCKSENQTWPDINNVF